ncbi:bifunctional metallophosphatase/5'-nucleotidase [Phyllobacterium leguminum]|uniref:2',3'-cyclic-nucleotide 2'-phosphodiesterase (5'-nucleotidase family) n=1 Tax=Phyllobacterium leguminum TaxID=314237 RepID=A0A318T4C5_9HYPH|nr:bifunctional UDP-sugar hydrolase/5'-nucleotidase [Phyllobacterium leguminum]PYE87759.1 2',3'-cyclic-nucleotide 2'-phosphodiesterase (5'-nucleotidase family) [Phyllobacterium leguminum]
MSISCIRVLFCTSVLAMSADAALADYTLNILHNNDWHSRIESINKHDSTCSSAEEQKNECFGGAARLKAAIDARRKALDGKNVLALNAGDNFQGSLFYNTYKGAAEAEFMNLMKFDAMTIGNHEFDDGEDGLGAFIGKVDFPIVSANVRPDIKSALNGKIKPYLIKEVGGQKIAIVGAVANDTAELASPGQKVTIAEDVATIAAAVEEVTKQGVNKVIALTHVGYPRDMAAIAKIPNVDVVVGGHSHTFLSNSDPKAEGPYPTLVDNPGGYHVPVVQAKSYGKYLGEFTVTFDDTGKPLSAKGDPILLDSSIKADEVVLARVKELAKPIEELKNKVIASSVGPIEGSREICRVAECTMGNLVADAMLDRVKGQGTTIAIMNGGGLRASIDAGDVTMGEVLTVLPFQNTLSTFQLKGADVKAALEHGVSQVDEGGGRFPQVAGLKYSFDKSKPAGQRINSVEVGSGNAWKPLDPAATYGVVANNFTRGGGDGYKVFATNAINAYDYGPSLEQVVIDYLAKNQPYKPYTDGRIKAVAMPAVTKAPEAQALDPAVTGTAKPAEPAQAAKPAAPVKPAETAKTAEVAKPAAPMQATKPVAQAKPAKPVQAAKPATPAKPDEKAKTAEVAKPAKPMQTTKPVAQAKPAKPVQAAKPAAPAKPDEKAKTAEVAKTAKVAKPAKPMQATKAVAPAKSVKPMQATKPAAAKPVKPMQPAKSIATTKPTTPIKPVKPMQAAKPTAPAKPAKAAKPVAPVKMTQKTKPAVAEVHIIKAGDTYWDLAARFYGNPTEWRKLRAANKYHPRRLPIGGTITVPARTVPAK